MRQTFLFTILRTLHLSASNPRDKVFGILGISRFSGTCIAPEYTRLTAEVLLNVAVTMLQEATLALYYFMALQSSRASVSLDVVSGLPSWVPDLTTRAPYASGRYFVSAKRISAYHLPDEMLGTNEYGWIIPVDAICSVLPFELAAFSPDLRKLLAPGVLIGTIVGTSGDLLNQLDDATSSSDPAHTIQHLYDSVFGQAHVWGVGCVKLP